jgi:tetratricopeptide (TPR) repeat protein
MSLLLEALKKAALEKQSKQDAATANSGAVASEVVATHEDDIQKSVVEAPPTEITEPDEAIEVAEIPTPPSEDAWPEVELPEPEPEPELQDSEEAKDEEIHSEFNDTLDQEDHIEPIEQVTEEDVSGWDDLDESMLGDEEFEEVGNVEFEEPKDTEPAKPMALEETEQSLQDVKLQQEDLLREQEGERFQDEAEALEAEALEGRKNQQRQLTARENRHALDQLIASGKAVAKRSKRRAMFLYAMLIMTALGGILAYYFYLLANSSMAELRQTQVTEPTLDVAGIIESTELEVLARDGQSSDARIEEDQDEMFFDNATTNLSGTVGSAERISPDKTLAGVAATNQIEATSNSVDSSGQSAGRQSQNSAQADLTPPANGYLRPLVTSDDEGTLQSDPIKQVIMHHEKPNAAINDLLQKAYAALQQRELNEAGRLYDDALKLIPNQRDALLGAASTAAAQGRFSDAASFYQKQLASNPKDSFARAGLLALMNDGKSRAAVEQEVATLLKSNPRSAHLHFLKGVGFAASQRWSPAQRAFYEAYNLDNANPDYAFNLAVSLDHLKQLPLAQVYYERALQLAKSRPANFDEAAVVRRLNGLKR